MGGNLRFYNCNFCGKHVVSLVYRKKEKLASLMKCQQQIPKKPIKKKKDTRFVVNVRSYISENTYWISFCMSIPLEVKKLAIWRIAIKRLYQRKKNLWKNKMRKSPKNE